MATMKYFLIVTFSVICLISKAQNKCDSSSIITFMKNHNSVKSTSDKIGKIGNIIIEIVSYVSGSDTLKSISLTQAVKSFGVLLSANVVTMEFKDIDTCISILSKLSETDFKTKPSGNVSTVDKISDCISIVSNYIKGFGGNNWQLQIVQSLGKEQQQEIDRIQKNVSMPMNFFIIIPISEVGTVIKKLQICKSK
jgi:hypothetical protein